MIFLSLRKTKKWMGGADYYKHEGMLYLLTIFREASSFRDFIQDFIYAYYHEVCHLLMRKLGVRGFHNEDRIFELAQRLELLDITFDLAFLLSDLAINSYPGA